MTPWKKQMWSRAAGGLVLTVSMVSAMVIIYSELHHMVTGAYTWPQK